MRTINVLAASYAMKLIVHNVAGTTAHLCGKNRVKKSNIFQVKALFVLTCYLKLDLSPEPENVHYDFLQVCSSNLIEP